VTGVPFGATVDATEEWVRSWSASVSERAARAQALSEQVARLSVSASDDEGFVMVTVAGSGVVTGIRLDERVRRWPAERIAAEVMATMRRAQASLTGRIVEVAAQTVGTESETARAVVASFAKRYPAEPPEDGNTPGGGRGPDPDDLGLGLRWPVSRVSRSRLRR
jgi:DNA-binding protein YbaB